MKFWNISQLLLSNRLILRTELLESISEIVCASELTIHRGKTNESYLIDRLKLGECHIPNLHTRNLPLGASLQRSLYLVHHGIEGLGRNVSLLTSFEQPSQEF